MYSRTVITRILALLVLSQVAGLLVGCDPLCPRLHPDAGDVVFANVGDRVGLDGTRSRRINFDDSERDGPDCENFPETCGNPLRFQWVQLLSGSVYRYGDIEHAVADIELEPGPAVSLDGADTPTPTFVAPVEGLYRFVLTVDEGCHGVAPMEHAAVDVAVTSDSVCPRLIADAGPDVLANVGDLVVLDGSNTRRANRDGSQRNEADCQGFPETCGIPLRLIWEQVGPCGSETTDRRGRDVPCVSLNDAEDPYMSFVAPAEGTYVFRLTAFEGCTTGLKPESVDEVLVLCSEPSAQ